MRQSMIDNQTIGERGTLTAAMEIEKRNLRTAALSAMAALCGGPDKRSSGEWSGSFIRCPENAPMD